MNKYKLKVQRVFRFISKAEYQYAVKTIRRDGEVKNYPVVKEPGFLSQWRVIVKVYDEYLIMDYEFSKGLSDRECIDHINAFKYQLKMEMQKSIIEESIEDIDSFSRKCLSKVS